MIGVRSSPSRSIAGHDLVARLQVPAERLVADLEQAARSDRAGADEVAGSEPHVGRCPLEHPTEREVGVGPRARG